MAISMPDYFLAWSHQTVGATPAEPEKSPIPDVTKVNVVYGAVTFWNCFRPAAVRLSVVRAGMVPAGLPNFMFLFPEA
jgi:hypothetical protein